MARGECPVHSHHKSPIVQRYECSSPDRESEKVRVGVKVHAAQGNIGLDFSKSSLYFGGGDRDDRHFVTEGGHGVKDGGDLISHIGVHERP